jgi:hypothetical protein
MQILGLERAGQVDRVPALVAGGRQPLQFRCEGDHRAQPGILAGRGKRPRVAERHRAEPARLPPTSRADAACDVQDGDSIDRPAPELVRRAVPELLEGMGHGHHADIRRPRNDDCRRAAARAASQRQRGHRRKRPQRRSTRHLTRWSSAHRIEF